MSGDSLCVVRQKGENNRFPESMILFNHRKQSEGSKTCLRLCMLIAKMKAAAAMAMARSNLRGLVNDPALKAGLPALCTACSHGDLQAGWSKPGAAGPEPAGGVARSNENRVRSSPSPAPTKQTHRQTNKQANKPTNQHARKH